MRRIRARSAKLDSVIYVAYRDPALGVLRMTIGGNLDQTFNPNLAEFVGSYSPNQSEASIGLLDSSFTKGKVDDSPMWISINLLPVGTQLLLTLAEVKTGRRMLLTLDSTGTVLRKTVFLGMFSFVALDRKSLRAIAARELKGQEVVLYRWRWRVQP